MGISVLEWRPQPGQVLPDPRLKDDSESFKPEQVKAVRAWLAQTAAAFEFGKPTDTTINGRESIEYCVGDGITEEVIRFRHCTVEICLRDKKHAPITARYRYLAARAMPDQQRVIVGPCLGLAQDQRIELASATVQ
jgi:hypothetical protein